MSILMGETQLESDLKHRLAIWKMPADKKRPPLLTGAKLPWFSRVARALLAANGGVAVGAERSQGGLRCLGPLRAGRGGSAIGRRGALGRQTVFHQPNVHAACPDRLFILVGLAVGVAEGNCVHTVDGNLMFCDKVA